MRVIGVDPGVTRCGFGIVEVRSGIARLVDVGTIRAEHGEPIERSLYRICVELERRIEEHDVEAMSVERLFFNRNTKTALAVAQASGVAMLAAAESGIPATQYTPSEVKAQITGVGTADKNQVTYMVRTLLRLDADPDSADASDALALALTHAYRDKIRSLEDRVVSRT